MINSVKIPKFDTEAEWLEARKHDVTSTDMAALLGVSKWKSRFALWHEKATGFYREFVVNERMKWGNRLQNAIALGICEDEGWEGENLGLIYIRDEGLRMGSSLDVKVTCPIRGVGLLEIKNVGLDAFLAGWTEDTAPEYYEIQLQLELHMANKAGLDISWGCIGALVGGNKPEKYFRQYDPEMGQMFETEVQLFWDSVANNTPPDPNYSLDGETLALLRGAVVPKTIIDISTNNYAPELIAQYEKGAQMEKEGEALKLSAKQHLLEIIGTADKATLNGYSISAGMVAGSDVSYYRETYRNFRITKTKTN